VKRSTAGHSVAGSPECPTCPEMQTDIQIGPTGKKLLPLTPV
jgi:hypothetical protein